jgi:hypothetical protein
MCALILKASLKHFEGIHPVLEEFSIMPIVCDLEPHIMQLFSFYQINSLTRGQIYEKTSKHAPLRDAVDSEQG